MVDFTQVKKKLMSFVTYVDNNPNLLTVVIGGYQRSPKSITLSENLNSKLSDTKNLQKDTKFGCIVVTSLFIADSKSILENDNLLFNFVTLWRPILDKLIEQSAHRIDVLRGLQITAAKAYQQIPDAELQEWFNKVKKLSEEFNRVLNDVAEEAITKEREKTEQLSQELAKIQLTVEQLSQEKETSQKALEEALQREKENRDRGITAPNLSTLHEATEEEFKQVEEYYHFNPVCGYKIDTVQTIINPAFQQKFEITKQQLQARQDNPIFEPVWPNWVEDDEQKKLRQSCYQFFSEFAKPFKESNYSNLTPLPLWHGTTQAAFTSILKTGYVNLCTTDIGFFGDGIYGTIDAEYAYRVYANGQQGVLLINWIAAFSTFPQVERYADREKWEYKKYDARFILVSPNTLHPAEKTYFPSKRTELPAYAEMVVSSEAACLPRYQVTLRAVLPPMITPSLSDFNYQVAENCERAQRSLVAFYYFMKAKNQGHANAQQKIDELLRLNPNFQELFGFKK